MPAVLHLLTTVELDRADEHSMSVSARLDAVLADGRRVVLLDDRGWSASLGFLHDGASEDGLRRAREEADIWAGETAEELERAARDVVGPDEPEDGRSSDATAAGHWGALADRLRGHGADVTAGDLQTLRHEAQLSEEILARLGR